MLMMKMTIWICEHFNAPTTMNKQHKMTLSQCDFYHLLFFGNMILYHLKSILFTVDP